MAHLNFSERSAFDQSDNEYDSADTIPMEFIKVEHIYDIMSDDFSEPEGIYDEDTIGDPSQFDIKEKDPLAPDLVADVVKSVEVMPTKLPEIKKEPPDVPEQDAEEVQHQENNGDSAAEAVAASPAPAFDDDDDDDDDDDTSQSSGRITRSQSKQSGQQQNMEGKETELEKTQGEEAETTEGKITDTGETSSRRNSSTFPNLSCPFCERSFASRKILEQHVNVHLREKPFTCTICGTAFNWYNNLKRHMNNIHKKHKKTSKQKTKTGTHSSTVRLEPVEDRTMMTAKAPASVKEITPVATLSERSESSQTVTVNQKECNDNEEQPSLASKGSSNDVSTSQGARIRFHACYVCGRKFSNTSILKQHMNVHSGEKPYECAHCGMTFGWLSSLLRHKRRQHKSKHKGKQPYKSAAKTNPVVSVQTTTKISMEKICSDAEVVESFTPQTEKMDSGIPQQTSLSDCNNQGSKRLILDHLRRHTAREHHQCNLCGRKFSSRWHLDRHVNSHPVMKPFRCPLCEKSFIWERNLKAHLCVHVKESDLPSVRKKTHDHTPIQQEPSRMSGTKANEDKYAVSEPSLVSEQVIRNESLCTMQCHICLKRFTLLGNLKRHLLKHMAIKPFSCVVCGKTFSRKNYLQSHCKLHYKNTNLKQKRLNMSPEKIDDKKKTSGSLEERDLTTEKVPEKSKAQKVHDEMTGTITKMPQQLRTKNNLVENNGSAASCSSQVTKEQYQCIMCTKQTNSKAAMLAHMQMHMGGSETVCSICGKKVNNLPRHMLQHTGEKLFQCTVCEKRFARKEHLLKHEINCMQKSVNDIEEHGIQVVKKSEAESKRRQSQCHICKKMFSRTYLKEHLRIHSGIKPFQCRFCSRAFRFKSGYLIHLKFHKMKQDSLKDKGTTKETLENALIKEIENDNVTKQQDLENFACSVCGRHLSSKAALLCHVLRHEGKGNTCNICDKTVSSKHLISHMRTHTGEKPFECEVCKKKFTWRESWQNHTKTHIQRSNLVDEKEQNEHSQKSSGCVEDTGSENLKLTETASSGNLKQTKKGNYFHSQMGTISKVIKKHKNINRKNFQCKICNKIISTRINFFIHMQSHSRDEMFSCKICHEIFSRRETLKIHMKSHTNISNKKMNNEAGDINAEKQKEKVHTWVDEELITCPKDLLPHKPTQSSRISTNDSGTDESFLVNHLKDHGKVSSSDRVEERKLLDKKLSHKTDSKNQSSNVVLVDTNQIIMKGNRARQGQDSKRETLPSQAQETVGSNASTSQSFEKRAEMIHPEVKTYETNSTKDAGAKNKTLACELCGKVFSQQPKLLRHLMNQSCSQQFECNVCHKKYSYKGRLDRHMLLHSDDLSKCNDDKARSPLQSLQEPEVIIIDSRSPSPENINESVSSDNQRFGKCGEDLHSMIVNGIKEKCNNENSLMNLVSPDKTPLQSLTDTAQPTATVSRDNVRVASNSAENRKPSVEMGTSGEKKVPAVVNSPRKTNRPEISDVDVSEVNKYFECDCCEPTFDTQRALLMHSRAHVTRPESQLKCNFCPLTFTCETTRLKHLQIHDTIPLSNLPKTSTGRERPENTDLVEMAEECAKKDENIGDGNQRSMTEPRWTEQSLEQCKVCSEKYNPKNLVKHMSVHTGGISFQCGLCDQMFSKETVIQSHAKTHDQKITINFLCHVCGQTLTSPRALADHVQTHTEQLPFQCRVCGKNFSDSSEYQVHAKSFHSGEKPFQCKICRKRFAWKINHLKHLNMHSRNNHVASTKAAENRQLMSKLRATVERRFQLAKNFDGKVGESSNLEGQGQRQFLEAEPAVNCTSRASEVRNHKENNFASLIEGGINGQMSRITEEMDNTGNPVTSNPNLSESSSTSRSMADDSPTLVRALDRSLVAARTSPFEVGDNHKRNGSEPSDMAQIKEALGLSRLGVEITAIGGIPKTLDNQKQRSIADIVITGVPVSERVSEGVRGSAGETSQRRKLASPSERSVSNALDWSNVEARDTAHTNASKLLRDFAKKSDPWSKHVISEGEVPIRLEQNNRGNTSAKINRNIHDLGAQVSGGAVQMRPSKEDSVRDDAHKVLENHKQERSPISERNFPDKLAMQKGKVGSQVSSNRSVINIRDTVIRERAISNKVQGEEVEILQETVGDHRFSLTTPVDLGGKSTVPHTETEFVGKVLSRGEITEETHSRFSEKNARTMCWIPPDITNTREPLSAKSYVELQEGGVRGPAIFPENQSHDVQSVESQRIGTTATKNIEIVDIGSEDEESPRSNTIPQRSITDQQAQRRECDQSEVTSEKIVQQLEGTELSRSFLPRHQLLPYARTEMAAEMNITNAYVDKQIDSCAGTKAGQSAHTISTPLTQSILQNHQLALQSSFQMPGTWKETAVRPHPDHTGYGNSVHNINPLMFAQPSGPWYGVPSNNYSPTPGGYYSWVPQTPSFQAISSSSVFMAKMPPPYPENNMYKNYPPPPPYT